jgi:hypothetical protein
MKTTTNNMSRVDRMAADQDLMDGLNKLPAKIPPIYVGGVAVPTTTIVSALQARVASAKTTANARANWLAAVEAERNERATTESLVSACKQALTLAFAGQVDTLALFGLTPRKPRVVSPETKVAAAAKAKATRQARHTLGSKQKAKVKGDVTGITVTPVVTEPPATPPPPGTGPGGAQHGS